jgi:hypothetical protein
VLGKRDGIHDGGGGQSCVGAEAKGRAAGTVPLWSLIFVSPFSVLLATTILVAATTPTSGGDVQAPLLAGQVAPAADTAEKEMLAKIRNPTTLIELLQNIKLALEGDLLLHEEFYADENLKRFFDTSEIKWAGSGRGRLGQLAALDDYPVYPRRYINLLPNLGNQDGQPNTSRKSRAGINMLGGASFPIDAVLRVFGSKMEISERNGKTDTSNGEALVLMSKTHEFGNMFLTYRFDGPSEKSVITFVTEGDGTVNRCNAREEAK